jgi:signal transduction histidine kinase
MKHLSIRQWFILSWFICLFLPKSLFEIVEGLQHQLHLVLGDAWIIGPLASAATGWGVTMLILSWLISRSVVKPLFAMQQAAHQIIAGDVHFTIPTSSVREVNDVAAAFTALSQGLQTAIVRQASLEQERRLLISAIAHDLRTPLFSLRGYLDGIERGIAKTPEKIKHYLDVCQQQASVLDQRIQILFDYTKMEYLEQPIQRMAVNWSVLVQQIIDRMRPAAEVKHIDVFTPPFELCTLQGDAQLLMRMLENVLDNAVRHTPNGGTITLSWQTMPGRLCFTIVDSGSGIAVDDLPFLFLPMYRGDASRRSSSGGGLGLTIAQRIAQAHGGELSASNHMSGGAQISGWVAT